MSVRRSSDRLHRAAERVASRLQCRADVEAVLLYGSVAQGVAGRRSDIDLLVVGTITAADVFAAAPATVRRRVSVTVRTFEQTHPQARTDWSLLAHIHRHGEVLFASQRVIDLLASPAPPAQVLLARIDRNARKADVPSYAYRMSRRCVFIANAVAGEHAVTRDEGLELFAARHPEWADDIRTVAAVYRRPMWMRKLRWRSKPLADREVHAARRIISAARTEIAGIENS